MRITKLQLALVAVGMFASAATVQATLINGELWEGGTGYAIVPSGAPDVTFTVNSPLNFDSQGTSLSGPGYFYTVGSWLGTGGATIVTGASHAGDSINPIVVRFTGLVSVTSGQQFTVAHDDGLTLTIGSTTVINAAGPTSPTVTTATYTGPSGNLPFELVYGEGWGPPAVLKVDLPFSNVPEPTTVLAGALLLLPFGVSAIRNLRRKS